MALTYFWRGESTTIDATHDYSAGSDLVTRIGTTASTGGTAGISGGGAAESAGSLQGGYGTFAGTVVGSTADGVTYPSTLEFAMACSFKLTGTVGGAFGRSVGFMRLNGNQTNEIDVGMDLDEKLFVEAESTYTLLPLTKRITLATTPVADQWYGLVLRWSTPDSKFKLELYTHNGSYGGAATLVESSENTDAGLGDYTPAFLSSGSSALAWFKQSGYSHGQVWDNMMVANNYDEPIQDNFTISSYTEYNAAPPSSPAHIFPVNELLARKATLSGGNA